MVSKRFLYSACFQVSKFTLRSVETKVRNCRQCIQGVIFVHRHGTAELPPPKKIDIFSMQRP